MSLLGRSRETDSLVQALGRGGPGLLTLSGPRGSGKTALLSSVLGGWEALHFQASDLTEPDLLRDLHELARAVFGEAPTPQRPGVLPVPSGAGSWLSLLLGIVDRVEAVGWPTVLVLDGMEPLLAARRRLGDLLGEAMQSARSRGLPFKLVLVARDSGTLTGLLGEEAALGTADLELAVPPLPFRAAGWGHGANDPAEAFRRWAVFGDHPAHLPREPRSESFGEAVIHRVLTPGGDLFDAPLRRLEITFQRPARYAAVLRALAKGPLDWSGILEGAHGIESGGQLAPYLSRLEEEGLVRAELPLGAGPSSRSRRYSSSDPFFAFWFGWVLPHRSALSSQDPREVWRSKIQPNLTTHFRECMAEAARRWLLDHAEEAFGVPSREVGAIWGDEAEFPVAGRLANGHVCFGLVDWEMSHENIATEMAERMAATRYGIGREVRAPIFFLAGEGGEDVRRMAARTTPASIVNLSGLMGEASPEV